MKLTRPQQKLYDELKGGADVVRNEKHAMLCPVIHNEKILYYLNRCTIDSLVKRKLIKKSKKTFMITHECFVINYPPPTPP